MLEGIDVKEKMERDNKREIIELFPPQHDNALSTVYVPPPSGALKINFYFLHLNDRIFPDPFFSSELLSSPPAEILFLKRNRRGSRSRGKVERTFPFLNSNILECNHHK